MTWGLGAIVFWHTGRLGVFGLGYDDLSQALAGDIGWQLAAVLLITKFVATFSCYGFGGCGGIFSPTLFLGGMAGIVVAGLLSLEWPIGRADALTLAVVGMSACLGAVVWAPVTGILIVFEMTHEFALVPALMVGALVSQTISRKMNRQNFYEELLEQDGHRLDHVRPPRDLRSWQQMPVSAVANFQPVFVEDLGPAALSQTLRRHPYQCFPAALNGKVAGILTRKDMEVSIADRSSPRLQPLTTCLRDQTIRELQQRLIESTTHFVVVLDREGGKPVGVVTLHDLLRAEANLAQKGHEGA